MQCDFMPASMKIEDLAAYSTDIGIGGRLLDSCELQSLDENYQVGVVTIEHASNCLHWLEHMLAEISLAAAIEFVVN